MQLVLARKFAVGWLLTCLVESLSGSPQRPHWTSPKIGVEVNYPEMENRFPLRFDHGRQYQGSSNSPYESIDRFQIEQRNQPQNGPGQLSQLQYDYEDVHFNQFRNDQESFYQSLLRVTQNPLKENQDHEIFSRVQERDNYYQDYLPLDENESFNVEQYDSKKTQVKNPSKKPSGIDQKVKKPADQKIAELVTKLMVKDDSYTPSLNDLDALNSLEDEMIAEGTVPDEIKREIRQVRRQQPGFLWTLARLAFDQVNDTKSAVNQIGSIINNNFSPEEPPTLSPPTTTTTTTISSADLTVNGTTTTTTTTEAPFRLTRTDLQGIIRRNLKGLIRLFNIEWRDALNQSQVSTREFQRDLRNQVRPYFDDNPNVTFN